MSEEQENNKQPVIIKIDIAKDFTKYPGGRYIQDGVGSGEEFRETVLIPALSKADKLEINLSSALGIPSSFCEEAFGGLIRQYGPQVKSRIAILDKNKDKVEKLMDRAIAFTNLYK